MEYRIGYRGSRSRDADLAGAEHSHWHVGVGFIETDHIDIWNVRVYGNKVFGDPGIHDPTISDIDQRGFTQRQPQSHYDGAAQLAAGSLVVEHCPDVEHPDPAGDTHLACVAINTHLAKLRATRRLDPASTVERRRDEMTQVA